MLPLTCNVLFMTNKQQTYYFIYIIVFTVLFGCDGTKSGTDYKMRGTPNYEVINLDFNIEDKSQKINLSSIAKDIEYIPLGKIEDIILSDNIMYSYVLRNDIFLFINASVERFDRSGNYKNSLYKVGKGPGECYGVNMAVDSLNKRLFVYNNFIHKINCYSFCGKLMKTIDDPLKGIGYRSDHLFYYNNHLIFITSDMGGTPDNWFYVYNLRADSLIYQYKNKYTIKSKRTPMMFDLPAVKFQVINDSLFFKEKYCDTIYTTTDFKTLSPKYVLNLGTNKLTYETDYSIRSREMKPLRNQTGVGSFIITDDFVICPVFYDLKPYIMVYDKNTNEILINQGVTINNDLIKAPSFKLVHPFTQSNFSTSYNALYSIVDPVDIIEKQRINGGLQEVKLENCSSIITINSNPILMKINLKK